MKFSSGELCLGGVDLGGKVFERVFRRTYGERLEVTSQGPGFLIGNEIQAARSRLRASSWWPMVWRAICAIAVLSSIGDHFDGVDKVLGLRVQAIAARVYEGIFIRNAPSRGLALSR
jgi:hypothetical protein